MKRNIQFVFTLLSFLFVQNKIQAQSSKAFAITGNEKGNINWQSIQQINLSTGDVAKTLFSPAKANEVQIMRTSNSQSNNLITATQSGVAAAAFDFKNNRLYYTTMRGNELVYLDVNTHQVIVNSDANFNSGNKFVEDNIITRMCFAANGYGYAITNNGNQLIQFTTDEKPQIKNLGSLIDGKKNENMSVHNQCTSWGGDVVGDVFGNLYLITMRSNVFKINISTLVTDYIGHIKNLPNNFTTNGAAVDEDGYILLASAANVGAYYKVNISTLESEIVKNDGQVYNSSDLASANLLYQSDVLVDKKVTPEVKGNQLVSIYPNPVVGKRFAVKFEKAELGNYQIQLLDATGKIIQNSNVNVNSKGQVINVQIPNYSLSGVYLLKILTKSKDVIYNDKIVVQ